MDGKARCTDVPDDDYDDDDDAAPNELDYTKGPNKEGGVPLPFDKCCAAD